MVMSNMTNRRGQIQTVKEGGEQTSKIVFKKDGGFCFTTTGWSSTGEAESKHDEKWKETTANKASLWMFRFSFNFPTMISECTNKSHFALTS